MRYTRWIGTLLVGAIIIDEISPELRDARHRRNVDKRKPYSKEWRLLSYSPPSPAVVPRQGVSPEKKSNPDTIRRLWIVAAPSGAGKSTFIKQMTTHPLPPVPVRRVLGDQPLHGRSDCVPMRDLAEGVAPPVCDELFLHLDLNLEITDEVMVRNVALCMERAREVVWVFIDPTRRMLLDARVERQERSRRLASIQIAGAFREARGPTTDNTLTRLSRLFGNLSRSLELERMTIEDHELPAELSRRYQALRALAPDASELVITRRARPPFTTYFGRKVSA